MKIKQAEDPDVVVEMTRTGEAADERKVGTLRDREKLAAAQLAADLKAVMSSPAGRRLMGRIVKECGVGYIAFRDTDRTTAFALGCQNTGHWIVSLLREHCLDLMRRMEDEDHDGTSN